MLLIALALGLSGCRSGPQPDKIARAIRGQLEPERATTIGEDRLLEPLAVKRFYAGRGFNRVWSDMQADQIVQAVHDVERDGLTPSDYHLGAIEALRREQAKSRRASGAADLDILLTDAVAGMVDHVRYGRVRPASLDPRWNVDPRDGTPPLEQEAAKIALSGSVDQAIEAERPQHFIYRGLMGALARLRAIAARGGWPTVPAGKPIKPGAIDARIPAVRERLMETEELPAGAPSDPRQYDLELQQAVKLFKARHRLDPNGIIDQSVIDAMKVSAAARVDQVRVNLERARWVLGGLSDDFVLVNLPAFKAYLIRGGKNVWEARTQIGDEAKQTPTFRADMRTVVLNPDWTVPPMILAEEVLPGMRKSEDYLSRKGLVVLDSHNQQVDPGSIDWTHVTPETFPYTLRQPAGEDNALGRVKFLFPNEYSIYLHDTPSRTLFDSRKRTFSHGCIRLEKPIELAEILLSDQHGWTREKIQEVLESGKTENVNLEHPLPVLIVYWTVSVGTSGEVRYTQDYYNLDSPVLAALNAPPR